MPSREPIAAPSSRPSLQPSDAPVDAPSKPPSSSPSEIPSRTPVKSPSLTPSANPLDAPTGKPVDLAGLFGQEALDSATSEKPYDVVGTIEGGFREYSPSTSSIVTPSEKVYTRSTPYPPSDIPSITQEHQAFQKPPALPDRSMKPFFTGSILDNPRKQSGKSMVLGPADFIEQNVPKPAFVQNFVQAGPLSVHEEIDEKLPDDKNVFVTKSTTDYSAYSSSRYDANKAESMPPKSFSSEVNDIKEEDEKEKASKEELIKPSLIGKDNTEIFPGGNLFSHTSTTLSVDMAASVNVHRIDDKDAAIDEPTSEPFLGRKMSWAKGDPPEFGPRTFEPRKMTASKEQASLREQTTASSKTSMPIHRRASSSKVSKENGILFRPHLFTPRYLTSQLEAQGSAGKAASITDLDVPPTRPPYKLSELTGKVVEEAARDDSSVGLFLSDTVPTAGPILHSVESTAIQNEQQDQPVTLDRNYYLSGFGKNLFRPSPRDRRMRSQNLPRQWIGRS